MKIAYVNSSYASAPGAAPRAVQLQAEAMVARGHAVSVLCLGEGDANGETRLHGVRVLSVRAAASALCRASEAPLAARLRWHWQEQYNPQLAREATALLCQLDPDVVCYHDLRGWSLDVWGSAQALGLPRVQVLRDAYLLCPSATMFAGGTRCAHQCLRCRALRWRHVRASQRLDAVIGVSRFILEKALHAGLFAGVPRREVLYDCRAARLPAARAAPGAQRAAPLRVGFIGTLAAHEGLELLLRSAQRLQHDGLELRVGVAEASAARRLRDQCACPTIQFVRTNSLAQLASSIDVCVVPSLSDEPLPSTVAEALGFGLPVIGTRRGAIPEMIRHEFNGLLFEPCEAALTATLQRLLAQPALVRTLAANCRVSAARFYDETTWAERHEEILYGAIATAHLRAGDGHRVDASLQWARRLAAHSR